MIQCWNQKGSARLESVPNNKETNTDFEKEGGTKPTNPEVTTTGDVVKPTPNVPTTAGVVTAPNVLNDPTSFLNGSRNREGQKITAL